MIAFEIIVNGQRRLVDHDITAITLVADWLARRRVDRVSIHVGVDASVEEGSERRLQYLGADLGPGDEVLIRILGAEQLSALRAASGPPDACSFCGTTHPEILSLCASTRVAICGLCVASLSAVITAGAPLPLGASIHDQGSLACGFCQKAPPDVAGLLVRNCAAMCPACLRACSDLVRDARE